MLTSTEMVAIVKQIDANYIKNNNHTINREDLATFYSQDIELHLPYGTPPQIGLDQVYQRILLRQSLFDHFEMEFKEPIVAGDTVVTCTSGTMQDRKNGDILGFEAVEISKFNSLGKICKKTFYLDLENIEHALGKQVFDNLIAQAAKTPKG